MWDLKLFHIYTLYIPMKKIMFFQCGIWNPLVYIFYVPKKIDMFFQRAFWNPLVYILYIPKEKIISLMWDKKNLV